jgi:hypothetical protein
MSTQITNVHDAFFKQVLGDPELAGQFLREHLPPGISQLLGPDSPEPLRPYLPAFRHALTDFGCDTG